MSNSKFITHLKLPFQFDIKKLQNNLDKVLNSSWSYHYNKSAYDGDWKSVSLLAENGKSEDIFASQNLNSKLIATPLLKENDYFRNVIETFKCIPLTARLLKLSVGARIKPHSDFKLGYENGNFRIHIPITTNDKVKFILDGQRIHMNPGECWYTNVNHEHSVANEGSIDRVHLIIDLQRNKWSDDLFFSLAPKKKLVLDNKETEIESNKRTIEELRYMDTPVAQEQIRACENAIQRLMNDL